MSKKTILSIVVLLVVVLGVFGVTKFVGAENKGAGESIVVSHELGETTVTTNPSRIVVFDYGILDSLDKLGIDGIVGVVQSGLPEYLTKYSTEEYSSIGSLKEPDMEKIFELSPDLIIISGRQADYYEELNKIAPTIHLGVDNENYLESFTVNMNTLGKIFNEEKSVVEELETITEAIEALNKKVTEKNVNGLIALANDGSFSVYGAESRFGIIHNGFGVIPVDTTIESSTHGQKASFEYVVEKNPQYLFVVDRAAIAGGTTSAKELFDNELMKKTDAYKNDNIVYLDPAIWYTSTGGFTSTMKMVEEVDSAIK
ncbi:siderophore ABC transporter substrate-binding protein [Clostridium celatum]|uniref:Periplasmic binding protein n=1 Tax=Clostridium celatum DSM 1785 TaxID=545697 RepID=L1QAU4_9CLOT|nr:siderophore ABC transporter substrate-binding protein [Clostridium celatum]EKY25094.1 periplasmic binding protein [Clostridium celatum DSM 1785]MCE9655946.1 siderophore ABC transporter substrate-binding protein [Clostridium celatum]MDU3722745.1 siderophore ABC transporter substrate-binding protein [Clostridium celatum]MDU6294875.1 siderophore ABC transporter substrate-binding protein [Clostridium celatum]